MEENCLAPEAYRLRHESPNFSMESRRLLRFTTSIQNIGDADFRPFIPKTAWEWHACHMHYHSMEVRGHSTITWTYLLYSKIVFKGGGGDFIYLLSTWTKGRGRSKCSRLSTRGDRGSNFAQAVV